MKKIKVVSRRPDLMWRASLPAGTRNDMHTLRASGISGANGHCSAKRGTARTKFVLLRIRLACLLGVAACLTACAPMLAAFGSHQTVVQIVAQIERVKLAGDGVSYVSSSKTITDHALSAVIGQDCKVFNVVTRDPVCTNKNSANGKLKLSRSAEAKSFPLHVAAAIPEANTMSLMPPLVVSSSVMAELY